MATRFQRSKQIIEPSSWGCDILCEVQKVILPSQTDNIWHVSAHKFRLIYCLLHWNRVAKLLLFHTINLFLKTTKNNSEGGCKNFHSHVCFGDILIYILTYIYMALYQQQSYEKISKFVGILLVIFKQCH